MAKKQPGTSGQRKLAGEVKKIFKRTKPPEPDYDYMRKQIQQDMDAALKAIHADLKSDLEKTSAALTDMVSKLVPKIVREVIKSGIPKSKNSLGGVLSLIESKLPPGDIADEKDFPEAFTDSQVKQITGACVDAVKGSIPVKDGRVVSDIPNLEKRLLDTLSVSTVDTVRHTVDMRGTEKALTKHLEVVRMHQDDLNDLKDFISKGIDDRYRNDLVSIGIIELNEITGQPLHEVYVRVTADPDGKQNIVTGLTNKDGVATFKISKAQYRKVWVYKSKPGYTFKVEERVL